MLKTFLESYTKLLPQSYRKLISKLSTHPNLLMHQSITPIPSLHPSDITLTVTSSSGPIPKGVSLFMIPTSQSFSNYTLAGANTQDRYAVQNFFETKKSTYEILESQEIKQLFRVLIQIYANEQQIIKGQMPLHYYSSLLLNEAYPDTKNISNSVVSKLGMTIDLKKYEKHIKSFHLLNILKSNQNTALKLYQILSNNFIRSAQQGQFLNLIKIVRLQMRQIHDTAALRLIGQGQQLKRIDVLSPILASLKFSNNPNCRIVGKYFTHLRQPFYSVQSLRILQPNEILTIPMKKGVNNYDKLIRYGYKSLVRNPQNADNEYMLLINLFDPSIPEVQQILLTGDIDSKKQILSLYKLKLKNMIKITKNGKIKQQDIKMLRILYGAQQFQQLQAQHSKLDYKIYAFISKFAKASLDRHLNQSKQYKSKGQTNDQEIDQEVIRSFRIIEQGQIQILNNFIKAAGNIRKL